MRANRLKAIWQAGGVAVNGWLQIPSSFSAEIMAHQGWDSLTVDLQHGVLDYQTAVTLLQAVSTTEAVPLARVPWNEPGIIMKMLDAGCYGIICPMINSRADAETFVGACRYPPAGYRSSGPIRALLYGGADYYSHADETVLTIAQIETSEAVENLEDILSVPRLDAVNIGPADLGVTLGLAPQLDSEEPALLAAIDTILETAEARGVYAGIHTLSPDYARRMADKGFQMVTVGSDGRLLAAAAVAAVKAMRDS
jgi:4-hydroxy-2-oxoheptanedioate aldolase